jgi:hypothetical protein
VSFDPDPKKIVIIMMIMISVLNRVLQSIPDHDIIVFDVVETT